MPFISQPHKPLRLLAALLLALGSLGVAPARACHARARPAAKPHAPTAAFTVTKTDDTADGVCDLDCSLREAIIAANASPGHDTITLPSGTYTLTLAGSDEDAALTGDLDLTDDLTLSGALSSTTIISTTGALFGDRVIEITPTAAITIENVTITGGSLTIGAFQNGSGILNQGTLTLRDSRVISNTGAIIGGGIFSDGDLLVSASDILSNTANLGGGLAHGEFWNLVGAVTTTARIVASRVEGNTAGQGSGVINWPYGVMQIEQSEIVSNTAIEIGGMFNTHHLSLISSTVAYNHAAGTGGLASFGQMTVTGSLIAYNEAITYSGGILNLGLLLEGPTPPSLIADSTILGNSGGGIYQYPGGAPLVISGTTIVSNTASQNGGGIYAEAPLTLTASHILSNTASLSGGGLYLTATTALITNTTIAGNFVSAFGPGGGLFNGAGLASLSEVQFISNTAHLGSAAANEGQFTLVNSYIVDNWSVYGGALFNAGWMGITDTTVISNSAGQYGGGFANEFQPDSSPAVAIVSSSTFASNLAGLGGGGIYNDGDLTISESEFVSNSVPLASPPFTPRGGAILNWGSLALSGNEFEGNSGEDGGALSNFGSAAVVDTDFISNTASKLGGALHNQSMPFAAIGLLSINGGTLANNAAGNDGGGLANLGHLTVFDADFSANTALGGGGLFNSGWLTMTGASLNANTAGVGGGLANLGLQASAWISGSGVLSNSVYHYGGGLSNDGGAVTITNSLIQGNVAGFDDDYDGGGGIYSSLGHIRLVDSVVAGNQGLNGGGVWSAGAASDSLTILRGQVFSNTAATGGGLASSSPTTVTDSTLAYNVATGNAGGLHVTGGLVLTNSLISNNQAANDGGGLHSDGDVIDIHATQFLSNTADRGGGAYVSGAHLTETVVASNTARLGGGIYDLGYSTLANTTISGNRADEGGGGLYRDLDAGLASTLNNVTLAHNTVITGDGGGLYISSTAPITLANTILSGNSDPGGEAPDCAGAFTTGGFNLIESTTGCTLSGAAPGDLTNTPALLAPLADNGGGTLTHALLLGSPALDAGNPAAPGTGGGACEPADQRGVARPQGPRCDIGAFESDLTPLPTVQFSHAAYTATESALSLPFTVTLSSAAAFTVQVTLSTTPGTAGPADFAGLNQTLTFTPGITSLTVFIPLTDNLDIEGTETLTLTLSLPVNALLGLPNPATATILDDDVPPPYTLYLPLIQRGPNPASALHRPRAASFPTRLASNTP